MFSTQKFGGYLSRLRKERDMTQSELAEKLKGVDPVRGALLAQKLERGLMAVPLVTHEALTTAYSNDVDASCVYAQQLYGFGRPGDVFWGITTSGNSENVIKAAVLAKALGLRTIGLTGATGGQLAQIADVTITVPETETYMVQEMHLPVYHCLCLMLEERFFGSES